MTKIAIFVEGQTELIVVREFLLRKYNYTVNIECLSLYTEGNLRAVEYPFSNPDATVFYRIINIGNDQKVLSAIIEREKSLFNEGYDRIVGLRDMYSRMYRERSTEINRDLNDEFIAIAEEAKANRTSRPNNIILCFAIMEIESWFLALHDIFQRIHANLTVANIIQNLNIDLETINPEIQVFHPANEIGRIYNLAGMSYDKRKGDIEAICSKLTVDDYEYLYASSKCGSFNIFVDAILNVA